MARAKPSVASAPSTAIRLGEAKPGVATMPAA
jgi:hypothetical protein